MTQTVAVIGTGLMGAPMARNLVASGHAVRAWNRTRSKAEAISGAVVCDTVAEAVTGADIVLTMLSDGPTVNSLVFDPAVTDAMVPEAIWLDMSSTKPEEARTQSAHLAGLGKPHLDAPVSGGTKGAEAATLAIMVGGEAGSFAAAEPVLQGMGRPVHVGPSGAGQLAKLANQAIVAVTIGAVAEAMLLLEEGGADAGAVRSALTGGFADSIILQQHGARMSNRDFVPGGLTKFQLKDLENVLAEAGGLNLKLPMVQHVRDRFDRLVKEFEGADTDHSALFVELLDINGRKP